MNTKAILLAALVSLVGLACTNDEVSEETAEDTAELVTDASDDFDAHVKNADVPPPSTAKWKKAWVDDFDGSSLEPHWQLYDGDAQGFRRSPSHCRVHDGRLTIRTSKNGAGEWETGGVALRDRLWDGGRFLARVRFDKGRGIRAVALLWPPAGKPPEVDFFEISGLVPGRQQVMFTNHFRLGTNDDKMQHSIYAADFTKWHVVGVKWGPHQLEYHVDGKVVAIQAGHSPTEKMFLALQGGIQTYGEKPDATTPDIVDYEIDWAAIYQRR